MNKILKKLNNEFRYKEFISIKIAAKKLSKFLLLESTTMRNRYKEIVSQDADYSCFPDIQKRAETFREMCFEEENNTIKQKIIPEFAFMNDSNLKDVVFDNCEAIEEYAFVCSKIRTATFIVNNVLHISALAFYDCPSLKEIYFTGTGTVILDDFAFFGCKNLAVVDNQMINPISFKELAIIRDDEQFLQNELEKMLKIDNAFNFNRIRLGKCVFPLTPDTIFPELQTDEVVLIYVSSPYQYFYSSLNTARIKITAQDNTIYSHAFCQCHQLKKIVIYGSPKIESYAFYHCRNLKTIIFDNMDCMVNVQQGAFCGNHNIQFKFDSSKINNKIQYLIDSGYYTEEPFYLQEQHGISNGNLLTDWLKQFDFKYIVDCHSLVKNTEILFQKRKYEFIEIKKMIEQLRKEKQCVNSVLKYTKEPYLEFYMENSLKFEPMIVAMELFMSIDHPVGIENYCNKLGHLYLIFNSEKKLNKNMNDVLSSDLNVQSKTALKDFFDTCSATANYFGEYHILDYDLSKQQIIIYSDLFNKLKAHFKNKDIVLLYIFCYCCQFNQLEKEVDDNIISKNNRRRLIQGISAAISLIECRHQENGEEFYEFMCNEFENFTYPGYPETLINVLNYQYFDDFELVSSAVFDLKNDFIKNPEQVVKDINKIVYPYVTDKQ